MRVAGCRRGQALSSHEGSGERDFCGSLFVCGSTLTVEPLTGSGCPSPGLPLAERRSECGHCTGQMEFSPPHGRCRPGRCAMSAQQALWWFPATCDSGTLPRLPGLWPLARLSLKWHQNRIPRRRGRYWPPPAPTRGPSLQTAQLPPAPCLARRSSPTPGQARLCHAGGEDDQT
jgi:hypothetical protein